MDPIIIGGVVVVVAGGGYAAYKKFGSKTAAPLVVAPVAPSADAAIVAGAIHRLAMSVEQHVASLVATKAPATPAPTALSPFATGMVTLPATGHVLSLPQLQNGELLLSYATRTLPQTGGNPALIGGIVLAQGGGPSNTGDPRIDWPIFVDWYFNKRAYMTPEQRAKVDADLAAWNAVHATMLQQASQPKPVQVPDGPVPIQGQ